MFLFSTSVYAETFTFYSFEASPYACEKCPDQGALVKAVREILKSKGHTVDIKFLPYLRATKEATDKTISGYLPEWPSDLPAEGYTASKKIFESHVILVTLKSKPLVWNTLNDLKGKKIGTISGYGYGEEFTALEKKGVFKADPVNDEQTNLKKLQIGRIDALITNKESAYATIKEAGLKSSDFDIQTKDVSIFPNIIGLNKSHPKYAENLKIINETLTQEQVEKIIYDYVAKHY